MSFYQTGAVRIHYEEAGSGFPLLLIAGGGLNSTIAALNNPFNAIDEFKGEYRCIAADLRLSLERSVVTPAGLYAIAALRIAIGLVFVLAAPASRAPRTVRVLGLIVIIAGLMTPWFGVARARAVLNWFATAGPLLMRVDAGVGVALGGFLVYVFRTPHAAAKGTMDVNTAHY